MAQVKYAGEAAVGRIANYVNKKLAFASSMPASPDANTLLLYIGTTTNDFTQGGVYLYDGIDWNLINIAGVELTLAEYQALPQAVQENGTVYFITDAGGSGGNGSIVEGYYNTADGKFYEDSAYTTEIASSSGDIYISLDTNMEYRYDANNSEFVQIAGSGSSAAIKYVDTLPTTNIEDIIYGTFTYDSFSAEVEANFLDENELFEKTVDGDDYTYTAAAGVELEASTDDSTYLGFVSISYSDTDSEWTLTYSDTTTETLVATDTFYYRQKARAFFAGNAEAQVTIPFSTAGGGGTYLPGEGIDINTSIISLLPATDSTLGGVIPDEVTIGVDASGVIQGKYEGGYGVKVDGKTISSKTFVGTQAEWNALTSAQQAVYDSVNITDDASTLNNTPGHAIQDSTTAFPQRTNLQFNDGLEVTDDSTNDITKVKAIPYTAGDKINITNNEVSCDETVKGTFIGTKAEWDALSTTDKAKYDIVNFTDDQSNVTAVVDTIADGNMNAVTSNAVYNAIKIGNKLTNMLVLSAHQPSENMVDIIKAICTESHPYFSASYQKLAVYFWYGSTIIYGHLYSYSYSSDNSTFGYGVHLMRISDGVVYTGYYQTNGWRIHSVTPTIIS